MMPKKNKYKEYVCKKYSKNLCGLGPCEIKIYNMSFINVENKKNQFYDTKPELRCIFNHVDGDVNQWKEVKK